ncbi:A24 family peptidase [Pseudidiomarina sp.]|uniref:prepilin peptidase n=1 Tax=Pseudidiomarina sp. TaxID=2081707 RepID=UPI00299D2D34|nr:A24 family peptidase [Pseudidiomarina sp.]MDX1705246.1 A24 family peptidase [Pseudidiomarina sp.]
MDLISLYPALNPWVTLFGVLLGLVVGSFLNVVIGRYPVMLQRQWQRECAELTGQPAAAADTALFNLATPGSHCPRCQQPIAWYDNIPLLSWIWLKAQCRHCKTRISARYPVIELLTGITFGILTWYLGGSAELLWYLILASILISLFFIDLDHMLLPDQLTLSMLWLGLLVALTGGPVPLADAVIGAISGYLFLWTVYWAFKLITGKEGMGYGDFKLLAAFGAWAGYQMLPVIIIAAAGSGAVLGLLIQALDRKRRGQPIPFGPFLISGGVIALIWGEQLLYGYWTWLQR